MIGIRVIRTLTGWKHYKPNDPGISEALALLNRPRTAAQGLWMLALALNNEDRFMPVEGRDRTLGAALELSRGTIAVDANGEAKVVDSFDRFLGDVAWREDVWNEFTSWRSINEVIEDAKREWQGADSGAWLTQDYTVLRVERAIELLREYGENRQDEELLAALPRIIADRTEWLATPADERRGYWPNPDDRAVLRRAINDDALSRVAVHVDAAYDNAGLSYVEALRPLGLGGELLDNVTPKMISAAMIARRK